MTKGVNQATKAAALLIYNGYRANTLSFKALVNRGLAETRHKREQHLTDAGREFAITGELPALQKRR